MLTVVAKDLDATSPNRDFFYRIDSGAQDKFRINYRTGEILVETRARLDREAKRLYHLHVSATDRGLSPLTGSTEVFITLDNVNDEMPIFDQASKSVSVQEDLVIGHKVLECAATDADDDSHLRYNLLVEQTIAYNERGEEVDVFKSGIDVSCHSDRLTYHVDIFALHYYALMCFFKSHVSLLKLTKKQAFFHCSKSYFFDSG